jgi:hypothetical protein
LPSTSPVHTLEPPPVRDRAAAFIAVAIFAVVCAIYNANGREIGSYDSQPTKFTAVELARRGSTVLDSVVVQMPVLGERPGFTRDRDGHYRTAFPLLPALLGGVVAKVVKAVHLVDLGAPLAAPLVAKLTASLLTALAVALAYLIARRDLSHALAILVALGLGLGTNLWAVSSQTLWQSETAVAALCGAVLCLAVPAGRLTAPRLWAAALFLGLAGAARPQLAIGIAVIALSIAVRRGRVADLLALTPLAVVTVAVVGMNLLWFDHPLGAVPRLESLHPDVHRVSSTYGNPLAGAAGLLVSPSRGLLVFSPIVLVAFTGLKRMAAERWQGHLRWWALAASAQFAFYASYAVWWGGHTYGPRYCLDILPLLVPLAVAGMPWVVARRWHRVAALAALAWSIALAGTGAFVYPNDMWNSRPSDVDQQHARFWDFRDPQFLRCWRAGLSPQNFDLFSPGGLRRPAVK